MKNMKLRSKLFVSFAIIIVMTIILGITGFVGTSTVSKQVNVFSEKGIPNTKYSQQIQTRLAELEVNLLKAIAETDITSVKQDLNEMDTITTELNSIIASYKANASIDTSLFSDLETKMQATIPIKDSIANMMSVEVNDEINHQAFLLYKNEYLPALQDVEDAVNVLITSQDTMVQDQVEDSNSITTTVYIIFIILVIFVILVAIFIVLKLCKLILTPVNEIEYAIHEMSQGNVHATVEYESRDEFGVMADSLRSSLTTLASYIDQIDTAMQRLADGDFTVGEPEEPFKGDFINMEKSITKFISKMSDTLGKVGEASVQVSSGANQVSSGAQALSQGTTEQASSVEELSATISEVSNQVSQNADNAELASQRANDVEAVASESSKRMQNMLQAMADISSSSSEIGKIIKTIEDIAFQTNILALNAAVEAARAGAAGKGFAVVADEVRNLASKSADASKNTAMLIETSIKAVQNGEEIANETAETLNSVVQGALEVAGIIDKISSASKDQATAISQVNLGMEQISAVIQTNSATAEESAAASEELSSQSALLKSLITQFKIKDMAFENDTYNTSFDTTEDFGFQDYGFDSKY